MNFKGGCALEAVTRVLSNTQDTKSTKPAESIDSKSNAEANTSTGCEIIDISDFREYVSSETNKTLGLNQSNKVVSLFRK